MWRNPLGEYCVHRGDDEPLGYPDENPGELWNDKDTEFEWSRTHALGPMGRKCRSSTPRDLKLTMIAKVFEALVGVNMDTRDQRKKEMMSVMRPP